MMKEVFESRISVRKKRERDISDQLDIERMREQINGY